MRRLDVLLQASDVTEQVLGILMAQRFTLEARSGHQEDSR